MLTAYDGGFMILKATRLGPSGSATMVFHVKGLSKLNESESENDCDICFLVTFIVAQCEWRKQNY